MSTENRGNAFWASQGLDLVGYAGKWKKAQELADRNEDESSLWLPYWERVRLLYLELGGKYIEE